jgi:RNA polymerase sigma-70 factor (ECF subfamily)
MRIEETTTGGNRAAFPETVWSTLQACQGPSSAARQDSLNRFITLYWRPVYAFIRSATKVPPQDAKDLTQEFFCYLLEGDILAKYAQEKGRLRSFLKGVLRHFLSDARREQGAQKRGHGKTQFLPDLELLDTQDFHSDGQPLSPEEVFDRQWATSVLSESLAELKRLLAEEKREVTFKVFEAYELSPAGTDEPTYASVGRAFGLSEDQMKTHLDLARARLEEIVRKRLSEGVSSSEELFEEIGELFST